jgi:hypothetical protein
MTVAGSQLDALVRRPSHRRLCARSGGGHDPLPVWLRPWLLPVSSDARVQALAFILLFGLVTQLTHQAVLMLHTRLHARIGQAMVYTLRERLFAYLQSISLAHHDRTPRGRHGVPPRSGCEVRRTAAPQGALPNDVLRPDARGDVLRARQRAAWPGSGVLLRVSDPRNPTFIRSDNPPDASITDEFAALSSGGFLVTFMGGANGSQPGRVVEYDAATALVQTWPSTPPPDGFNPHGLSIDEAHNLMVTSDFICALPTLHVHGGSTADLRGSVRVWDFARREITKTIVIGDPARPAGTMEVQLIPRDQRLRAYTAGMADNKLYLVDTQGGTATSVFDFDAFSGPNAPAMPQLLRMNRQGTRLFVTLNGAGMVVMFNIARPDHPQVMSVVDLGRGSGPHFLRLTSDEKRLVVTDYFLVEDLAPGGIVNGEGDHKIHVINVHGNRLELDTAIDVDFDRDISTGPARPHGVALFQAQDD